jgi:hypothetical protein
MTTTEHAYVPPIVCAPWCADQDRHPECLGREDQTCSGPDGYVEFSLEEPHREGSEVYVPRIGALAYRQWPGAAPCVYVYLDGIKVPFDRGGDSLLDDSVHLTADEVIRLATALLKAAEDVRSGAKR